MSVNINQALKLLNAKYNYFLNPRANAKRFYLLFFNLVAINGNKMGETFDNSYHV